MIPLVVEQARVISDRTDLARHVVMDDGGVTGVHNRERLLQGRYLAAAGVENAAVVRAGVGPRPPCRRLADPPRAPTRAPVRWWEVA